MDIEKVDSVITIPNWSKHQTLDQIEERNKYMKQYIHTYRDWETDRKSTRLNSSHRSLSRMPSSA